MCCYHSRMIPIFVYGTLRRGESNAHILTHSSKNRKKEGLFTLTGYDMYSICSSFPGIIPGEGSVIGEVYLVDYDTLERLDILEGVPSLYKRQRVKLSDNSIVQTYIFQQTKMPERDKIYSGDWVEFNNKEEPEVLGEDSNNVY